MTTQEDYERYGDNDSAEISKEIMSRGNRYSEEEVTRIVKVQAEQFAWFGREINKMLDDSLERIKKHD